MFKPGGVDRWWKAFRREWGLIRQKIRREARLSYEDELKLSLKLTHLSAHYR